MVVGMQQIDDGILEVTSVLMFQVCLGEINPGVADNTSREDIAWFAVLDFFCFESKNVPSQEDFAVCFHIACTEVKSSGIENTIIFARSSKSPLGDRKAHQGLLPEYSLKRYGFVDTCSSVSPVERVVMDQLVEAQKVAFREHRFPLFVASFTHDKSIKSVDRSMPVSCRDGLPLFVWEGMCLSWVQASEEQA